MYGLLIPGYQRRTKVCLTLAFHSLFTPGCCVQMFNIPFCLPFPINPATDRNLSPTPSVLRKEGEPCRESEKLIIFVYLY